MGLAHLFREWHFLYGRRTDGPFCLFLLSYPDCGKKRTHTDTRCAQVINLIDLQCGVDFVGIRQDLRHLVCCHGIQTAAKGVLSWIRSRFSVVFT